MADDPWPPGIDRVGVEDLTRLGIDRQDQLYWDGRRIEIRKRLDLTPFQQAAAILVTVFAILGGLGAFMSGLQDGSVFLCDRGVHLLACPAAAAAK
jgi:hypothetical protein